MKPDLRPVLRKDILRSSSVACAVALALATLPRAQAVPAPGSPVGSPITVAALSSISQFEPQVAADALGDFVVVWQAYSPITKQEETYAERYAADGIPEGSAIQVNSDTSGLQGNPSVAMDAAGDFVVAWQSDDQASPTSGDDVYAQLYASNGTPLGSNFLVNSYTSGFQGDPSVAMDAAGDFVVAWQSDDQASPTSGDDVYAQLYASNGVPLGSNFLVNSYTSGNQEHPAVAMDATGDFVVTWKSYNQASSTSRNDIYAQRFASNGAPLGSAFLVNSYTSGNQVRPAVAMDATGDFVVAWESYGQASPTSRYDVYAERYASNGAPLGSNFLVNTYTSGNQELPAVAMDAAGDFVVAWASFGQSGIPDNYADVYAQRYSAGGAALGSEFLVNPTSQPQQYPTNFFLGASVAMDATGDFVVAWQQDSSYYNYTTYSYYNESGIGAQRYQGETAASADVAVTGVSSDSTVTPGSPFSVSFEVVNRTAPTFETTDAYLNSFIGGVSNPTITVTLGQDVAALPAGGPDWSCTGSRTTSFTCTYAGVVAAGQYSPPLIVGLVAPDTPGTISYQATAVGSSEPAFTGSVAVANPPGGSSGGGGGGFGWIELLGLASLSFLRRFGRKSAA